MRLLKNPVLIGWLSVAAGTVIGLGCSGDGAGGGKAGWGRTDCIKCGRGQCEPEIVACRATGPCDAVLDCLFACAPADPSGATADADCFGECIDDGIPEGDSELSAVLLCFQGTQGQGDPCEADCNGS
jgi:hypothetical protein